MQTNYALRVAEEVRGQLGRRRMSGTALATHMGVSQAVISRRLTGEVPFTVAELDEIARILEVPITHFLPLDDDQPAIRKAG